VVLENDKEISQFRRWAHAAKSGGGKVWMQINHPGRQMPATLGQRTWAPSEVSVDLGKMSKFFKPPREMSEAMIHEVIDRFVETAALAEEAGFDGVEVHAAHGYLLSQFLSPLTNKRNDQWGGSLENRARFLLTIVERIRAVVSPEFAVAVKINSADFQRGGFDQADARSVVKMLNKLSVDLVELSGGSYEAPAMHGSARDGRTLAREAYFLEFANDIREVADMPVMVTGGIRRLPVAEQVVNSGVEMVGIATALAIDPDLPAAWKKGQQRAPELGAINWKSKPLASLAYMSVVKYQLVKNAGFNKAKPDVSPAWALVLNQVDDAIRTYGYKRSMKNSFN
jgi:2,4-dienoyl-CoA reductase-like NADH-dependent reductase (Old Yellow Enzyme family)